jgi:hypothetical protein
MTALNANIIISYGIGTMVIIQGVRNMTGQFQLHQDLIIQ